MNKTREEAENFLLKVFNNFYQSWNIGDKSLRQSARETIEEILNEFFPKPESAYVTALKQAKVNHSNHAELPCDYSVIQDALDIAIRNEVVKK